MRVCIDCDGMCCVFMFSFDCWVLLWLTSVIYVWCLILMLAVFRLCDRSHTEHSVSRDDVYTFVLMLDQLYSKSWFIMSCWIGLCHVMPCHMVFDVWFGVSGMCHVMSSPMLDGIRDSRETGLFCEMAFEKASQHESLNFHEFSQIIVLHPYV